MFKTDFDVDTRANLMANCKIHVNLSHCSLICLVLLEMEFDKRYLVCCIKTHKLVFMRYCQDIFCNTPHLCYCDMLGFTLSMEQFRCAERDSFCLRCVVLEGQISFSRQ